jgi:hypothetical protein
VKLFWFNFAVLIAQFWLNDLLGWTKMRAWLVGEVVLIMLLRLALEWRKAPR